MHAMHLVLPDNKKGHTPTPLYAAINLGYTSIAKVGATRLVVVTEYNIRTHDAK